MRRSAGWAPGTPTCGPCWRRAGRGERAGVPQGGQRAAAGRASRTCWSPRGEMSASWSDRRACCSPNWRRQTPSSRRSTTSGGARNRADPAGGGRPAGGPAAAARRGSRRGLRQQRGTPTAGRTCAVPGQHLPRLLGGAPPRGRAHHGLDMVAATGTPLVPSRTGWSTGGVALLVGNNLYLRGDSTDIYYYAHLNGFARRYHRRGAGQQGPAHRLCGSYRNAATPHLHLGYQPAGARSPTPTS